MDRTQYLESIKQTSEMIENLFKIKSQLQEAVIKDTFDKLSPWKHKNFEGCIAYVMGIDYKERTVIIDFKDGHYKGVKFTYSEFMNMYEPR